MYTFVTEYILRKTLEEAKFPYLTLTCNYYNWIPMIIRKRTKHSYTHSMTLKESNKFASQDFKGFRLVDVSKYINPRKHRIKLWYNPSWTDTQIELMRELLEKQVEKKGKYDWLGVIGQLFGARWLNSKKKNYCSEQVASVIRLVDPEFTLKKPSPADLDRYFSDNDNYIAIVYDPTI
jgi:hypothetical protein